MKRNFRLLVQTTFTFAGVSLLAVVLVAQSAQAVDVGSFILTNGNSTATITPQSQYGMSDWTVDGQTQLYRQWFYYRKGSISPEFGINNLSLISAVQSTPGTLTTLYQNADIFSIAINYSLLGGALGSSSSSIGEQITINNLTSNPLNFHFFQYVDFDLAGYYNGDTVSLEQNAQGLFEKAYQTKGNAFFSDEIVSPAANHGEVGLADGGGVSQSIFSKLNDAVPTTLNDNVGPVTGDAVWAFQWDITIPANQSFDIAINKSVYVAPPIPEPTTIALVSLGLAALGFNRGRRSS